jgi:hypothetical protein
MAAPRKRGAEGPSAAAAAAAATDPNKAQHTEPPTRLAVTLDALALVLGDLEVTEYARAARASRQFGQAALRHQAHGPAVCEHWLDEFEDQMGQAQATVRRLRPPAPGEEDRRREGPPLRPFRFTAVPTPPQIFAYLRRRTSRAFEPDPEEARHLEVRVTQAIAAGHAWARAVEYATRERRPEAARDNGQWEFMDPQLAYDLSMMTGVDYDMVDMLRLVVRHEGVRALGCLVLLQHAVDAMPLRPTRDNGYAETRLFNATFCLFSRLLRGEDHMGPHQFAQSNRLYYYLVVRAMPNVAPAGLPRARYAHTVSNVFPHAWLRGPTKLPNQARHAFEVDPDLLNMQVLVHDLFNPPLVDRSWDFIPSS